MKLIIISSPDFIENETAFLNRLFENGLAYLHIRKPDAQREEVEQLLKKIQSDFHSRIALHQWHDLKETYRIGGLHFSEDLRAATQKNELSKLKLSGLRLSTSIHHSEQLDTLDKNFDYVFLSPVFNSISKKGYVGKFSNEPLAVTNQNTAVIGLGGIDDKNIDLLRALHFDGAALLGHIWETPELSVPKFQKINERFFTTSSTIL